MKTINLKLEKNKKYVIACSFGPDSMALLDAAIKENLNIVVAHVNYRKRKVSLFEQESLTKYCNDRNIKIYVLDLLGEKAVGNFQAWAREKRYLFFKDVLLKEKADSVLVAHQQDDVIETYLMQKKRGNLAKFAGISPENELFGVKVIRPLLNYSKKYLEEYDIENGVPYSIDESNLTDHYTRNIFRHHIVNKLNDKERAQIVNEINKLNCQKNIIKFIDKTRDFLNLEYEEFVNLLSFFMEKVEEHRNLSRVFFEEIKKAVKTKKNISFEITPSIILDFSYGDFRVINQKKIKEYCFEFIDKIKTDFIDIDFSQGTEDRKVDLKNKKLILKNCTKNDKFIIKNYSSYISRLFIDWKMPQYLRKIWPGIYDEKGMLIYVPRFRKDFEEKNKSKFVINTKYFEEF